MQATEMESEQATENSNGRRRKRKKRRKRKGGYGCKRKSRVTRVESKIYLVVGYKGWFLVMETKGFLRVEILLLVDQALTVGEYLCKKVDREGGSSFVWEDGDKLICMVEGVNKGGRFMKVEVSGDKKAKRLFVPFGIAGWGFYRVGVMLKTFSKLFLGEFVPGDATPVSYPSLEKRIFVWEEPSQWDFREKTTAGVGEIEICDRSSLGSPSYLLNSIDEHLDGGLGWWKLEKSPAGVEYFVVCKAIRGEYNRVEPATTWSLSENGGFLQLTLDPTVVMEESRSLSLPGIDRGNVLGTDGIKRFKEGNQGFVFEIQTPVCFFEDDSRPRVASTHFSAVDKDSLGSINQPSDDLDFAKDLVYLKDSGFLNLDVSRKGLGDDTLIYGSLGGSGSFMGQALAMFSPRRSRWLGWGPFPIQTRE